MAFDYTRRKFEGQRNRDFFNKTIDPKIVTAQKSKSHKFKHARFETYVGNIVDIYPEPLFIQNTVGVEFVRNGKPRTVGWPGPNVELNKSGKVSPSTSMIHGLYESPMPGQQVLVGFVEGNADDPIVIQKYPYKATQVPEMSAAHNLPMTSKQIGATDVVLGHFTGSYIALRGTIPLPSQIDISSESTITLDAKMNIDISCIGKLTEDVSNHESKSQSNHKFSSAVKFEVAASIIDLTASASVLISASPAVVINSGSLPAARMGDKTPTMLGLSPIVATGTSLLL